MEFEMTQFEFTGYEDVKKYNSSIPFRIPDEIGIFFQEMFVGSV